MNTTKSGKRISVQRSSKNSSFDLTHLRSAIKPFRLHFFTRLRSTNDHAAFLRKRGKLFAPAIVLTPHQLAGRGRGGNSWWSGDGSLTVTFVLPVQDHRQPHQVPLLAGLAVRNAIAAHCGIDDVKLKWPNDLLHDGRKLAGLLCERIDGVDLIGLGLNVNVDLKKAPPSLRHRLTSLCDIGGVAFDLTALLIDISQALHQILTRRDEPTFAAMLKEYDRHHALVGKTISIAGGPDEEVQVGTCVGMDRMGRLLLRGRSGISRIIAGQVTISPGKNS